MPPPIHFNCHPLILDDDLDFTLLLKRGLEKAGVPPGNIRSVADGEDAIALLSGQGWIPSFILLDLHMPQRSGLEVLEWIRSTPLPSARALVFLLTSEATPEQVTRALRLKVGGYFIKPLGIRKLQEIVDGVVAYWRNRSRPGPLKESLDRSGRAE